MKGGGTEAGNDVASRVEEVDAGELLLALCGGNGVVVGRLQTAGMKYLGQAWFGKLPGVEHVMTTIGDSITSDPARANTQAVATAMEIIGGVEQSTFHDGTVMDTPFSIGPAAPDHQTIQSRISHAAAADPIKVSTDDWRGLSPREHREKSVAVATTLESEAANGNPIINTDRDREIKVSVGGMKHWSRFAADPRKAALVGDLRELLTNAVFLRSEKSDSRKSQDQNIKGFHRLALPVLIDGKETVVFLTIREDQRGHLIYDGRVLEMEAPADRSKTSTEQTLENQAVSDIRQARGEVIRDHLEVNKHLSIPDAFSISHGSQVDSLVKKSRELMADPAMRAAMFERMSGNMSKLKSEPGRIKMAFGKTFQERALSDQRAGKSLKKEAAFREAARRAELEDSANAKHEGILTNPDLAKLKSQPVHEFLSQPGDLLHGRLMSASAARGARRKCHRSFTRLQV